MNKMMMGGSALLIAMATIAAAQSDNTVRLTVRTDSKLTLDGSSNVHDWSCTASSYEATVDADSAFAREALRGTVAPKLIRRVEVKIPVANLKCGHEGLEKNLQKALKASVVPQIRYILGSFDVVPAAEASGIAVSTLGTLSVAGKDNPVKMDVKAERLPDGTVRATGEIALLMSDFGVKPPTALLGAIKAKDKVTVKFELLISPQTIAAAAGPEQR